MKKYIVTIDCKQNNRVCFYADNVQRFERYSVLVDDNPVSFEYPVIGVNTEEEEIPSDVLKKCVIHLADGNTHTITCAGGRYNPDDPYTFIHNNGTLEFQVPITGLDVFVVTEESRKHEVERKMKEQEEAATRRQEGNCPVQGQHVTLYTRADDISIVGSEVGVVNRVTLTVNKKPLELKSPVIGFSTNEDPVYRGSVYVNDGLTYFINFTEHVHMSPNVEIFDGVKFVFEAPTVLDNVQKIKQEDCTNDGSTKDEAKFCRQIFTPAAIDVFLDKLYIIALEKDMFDEAQSLRKLMNKPVRKYCRTVLKLINQVGNYEELIKLLHKNEDGRTQLIIDEFWEALHRM